MCCDGIVIVTEVPFIGKCTGGYGRSVGEGEGVVGEALDIVIDREVDGRFRVDGDIDFGGIGTVVAVGSDECYGIVTGDGVSIGWVFEI